MPLRESGLLLFVHQVVVIGPFLTAHINKTERKLEKE